MVLAVDVFGFKALCGGRNVSTKITRMGAALYSASHNCSITNIMSVLFVMAGICLSPGLMYPWYGFYLGNPSVRW